MDIKIILGYIALLIGIIGFFPYLKDILNGKTRPHIFSWLIWTLITAIVFFAQVTAKAGPGAWVTGIISFGCLLIVIFSIKKGEKEIKKIDWYCFFFSLLGILLWITTDNPLSAVLVVTFADVIAYIPTLRKSFYKPWQETMLTYFLNSISFFFGFLAIEKYSLENWLYPAAVFLMDGSLVLTLYWRRKVMLVK